MQFGVLSLSVSLGLDGTWIDLADQTIPGRAAWPSPPELTLLTRQFRHANLVDEAMLAYLQRDPDSTSSDDRNVTVVDVDAVADRNGVVGTEHLMRLLKLTEGRFVHLAGGARLTEYALSSGQVLELDVTLYPVTGGKRPDVDFTWSEYQRLHVQSHEDGRVTTIWRRR